MHNKKAETPESKSKLTDLFLLPKIKKYKKMKAQQNGGISLSLAPIFATMGGREYRN